MFDYKWINSTTNEDGTFDLIIEHKHTGEQKILKRCYLADTNIGESDDKITFSINYDNAIKDGKPIAIMKRDGEGKWVLRDINGKTLGKNKYRNDLRAMFGKEYIIQEE